MRWPWQKSDKALRIKKLEDALLFYANHKHYAMHYQENRGVNRTERGKSIIDDDNGRLAREALSPDVGRV